MRLLLLPLLQAASGSIVASSGNASEGAAAAAEVDLSRRTPAERLNLGDPYMSLSEVSFLRSVLGDRSILESPSRVDEANFLRNLGE